jgi:hypothetical protein
MDAEYTTVMWRDAGVGVAAQQIIMKYFLHSKVECHSKGQLADDDSLAVYRKNIQGAEQGAERKREESKTEARERNL